MFKNMDKHRKDNSNKETNCLDYGLVYYRLIN